MCHESGEPGESRKRRPFVCTPYAADDSGCLRPVGRVEQCPLATADEECAAILNGFRERKTGPHFPIQVMLCQVHGRSFTVYPMGFVPYGRVREAPVDVAGGVLEASEAAGGGVSDERWSGTRFRCRGVGR